MAFEIKGHPHVMSEHEQEGRCFFATAKAYPSRNTAMWVIFPATGILLRHDILG